jgi:hypothetical protein
MSPKGKRRFQLKLKSASIGAEDPEINKVQKYLTRFGYLTNTISPALWTRAPRKPSRSSSK